MEKQAYICLSTTLTGIGFQDKLSDMFDDLGKEDFLNHYTHNQVVPGSNPGGPTRNQLLT